VPVGEHPLRAKLGDSPVWNWNDDDTVRWYEDAFEFRIENGIRALGAEGTARDSTPFWSAVKKRAEELIPTKKVRAGVDYALTEVVHCKSRNELGVKEALETCSSRYLRKTLEASYARAIVVLGSWAAKAVERTLGLDSYPLLRGPVMLGSRVRHIAFLPHPNARKPRTFAKCFSAECLEILRRVVAGDG
jgi:uracil-DNA glycosylase